jgi:hypothetical protein
LFQVKYYLLSFCDEQRNLGPKATARVPGRQWRFYPHLK